MQCELAIQAHKETTLLGSQKQEGYRQETNSQLNTDYLRLVYMRRGSLRHCQPDGLDSAVNKPRGLTRQSVLCSDMVIHCHNCCKTMSYCHYIPISFCWNNTGIVMEFSLLECVLWLFCIIYIFWNGVFHINSWCEYLSAYSF